MRYRSTGPFGEGTELYTTDPVWTVFPAEAVSQLADQLATVCKTNHLTHHVSHPPQWLDCPLRVCADSARLLRRLGLDGAP